MSGNKIKLFDVETESANYHSLANYTQTVIYFTRCDNVDYVKAIARSCARKEDLKVFFAVVDPDIEAVERFWRATQVGAYWSGPRGLKADICVQFKVFELPFTVVISQGRLQYKGTDSPLDVLGIKESEIKLITSESFMERIVNNPYVDARVFPTAMVEDWAKKCAQQNESIAKLQDEIIQPSPPAGSPPRTRFQKSLRGGSLDYGTKSTSKSPSLKDSPGRAPSLTSSRLSNNDKFSMMLGQQLQKPAVRQYDNTDAEFWSYNVDDVMNIDEVPSLWINSASSKRKSPKASPKRLLPPVKSFQNKSKPRNVSIPRNRNYNYNK